MNRQLHLVRIIVHVQKICLSVKFPCSVSVGLKTQKQNVTGKGNFPLQNGEAFPKDILKIELEIPFKKDTYEDKYITLALTMTSANGSFAAGSVPILINSCEIGQTLECNQSISKCPDKHAQVTYTIATKFLKVVENEQQFYSWEQFEAKDENQTTQHFTHQQLYPKTLEKYNLKLSAVNDNRDRNFNSHLRYSTIGHRDQSPQSVKSGIKTNYVHVQRPVFEKKQLHRLHDNLRFQKQKNWQLQKRQKELKRQKKKLQDELSIKKQKQSQYQMLKLQTSVLSDKQSKVIQDLQDEVLDKMEELQQLQSQLSAEQKKNQISKASFQEQYASILKKYKKSEQEKTQALKFYNQKLQQIQLLERKHRLILKERQRVSSEEKLKDEKLIVQLKDIQKQLKSNIIDLNAEIEYLKQQISTKNNKIAEQEIKIQELQTHQKYLTNQLRKQLENKKKLKQSIHEKQIQQYRSTIEQLQLKNIQLNSKLIDVQNSYDQEHQQNQFLCSRINECQLQLKQYKSRQSLLKDQYDEQINYYINSTSSLQNSVKGLTEKANKYKKAYLQLQQELLNSNQENTIISRNLLQIEEEFIYLKENERKAQMEIQLMNNQMETIENNNKTLQELLNKKNQEIGQLKNGQQIHSQMGNIQMLTLKQMNNKLLNDQNVFRGEINHLQASNESLRERNKSLQIFVQQLNNTILHLRQKILANQQNPEQKNVKLSQKQKQIISLRVECERYKNQLQKCTNQQTKEIKYREEQLDQQLQTRFRQLQMNLQEKEFQLENEKQKINKMISENQWLLKENIKILQQLQLLRKGKEKPMESHQTKENILNVLKEISTTITKTKRIIRSNELHQHLLHSDFKAINDTIMHKI